MLGPFREGFMKELCLEPGLQSCRHLQVAQEHRVTRSITRLKSLRTQQIQKVHRVPEQRLKLSRVGEAGLEAGDPFLMRVLGYGGDALNATQRTFSRSEE